MTPTEMRNVTLDSIALLMCAWRQDAASVDAMINSYDATGESKQLAMSLLANAICILNVAARAGVNPELLLGGAAMEIHDAP